MGAIVSLKSGIEWRNLISGQIKSTEQLLQALPL